VAALHAVNDRSALMSAMLTVSSQRFSAWPRRRSVRARCSTSVRTCSFARESGGAEESIVTTSSAGRSRAISGAR
jgi:hypothetical protein